MKTTQENAVEMYQQTRFFFFPPPSALIMYHISNALSWINMLLYLFCMLIPLFSTCLI